MDRLSKHLPAILLMIALGAAVALASSLSNLSLGPGQPFPAANSQVGTAISPSASQPATPGSSTSVLSGLLAILVAGLGIYVLVRLITFTNLRRLLWIIVTAVILFVILVSLPRVAPGPPTVAPTEQAAPLQSASEVATSPLGAPPIEFIWLVLVGAGLLAGLLLFVSLRRTPPPKRAVRREAERAIRDIEAGLDATDVVIRSYLQMVRLLQRDRGIERERGVTVREFEITLDALGLPSGPLTRLRELFELVRYGNRKLSSDEQLLATESLNSIVTFLRPAGNP